MNRSDYTLSIVIPCYDEKVLESSVEKKEIIVVDDKTEDDTSEILDKEIALLVNKVVHHEVNQGKGAALRTGLKYVTGDIVTVQDADLEYDPSEYESVVLPIAESRADVVYGSDFLSSPHKCRRKENRV